MNNPFLPMATAAGAHSTPNIDQSKVAALSRNREAIVTSLLHEKKPPYTRFYDGELAKVTQFALVIKVSFNFNP